MALNLRQNEILGSGNPTHSKEAADYSKRAIELIEAGVQPAGVDASKWNKDGNLAWLHQNLALIAATAGAKDEALKQYEQSSALAPSEIAIQARNTLGCGSIYKDKYDESVAKYQALPEAERSPENPSPTASQLIEQANQDADRAIDSWAHFLGVTKGTAAEAVRTKMEATLAAFYKYRHPEEPEGYKALVEKYSPAP
jgi:tetratricopeptide (TPR) repeat protein